MRTLILVGIVIGVSYVALSFLSYSSKNCDVEFTPQFSATSYSLLKTGMTKHEVDETLWNAPNSETMSSGNMVVYAYTRKDGARIAVTFQDGRLTAKAQNGL